ncbi:hypothetical protein PR048_023616 [Dryococelus australis]|uniref:Uncharacterized protein n=1 Tax=Dryococelus australis TaxID=614101 RepID=A0ABQ9GUK9_9NEOP|nr:hypothetical protein PR048_023616 [Dryococelus australis]
MWKRLSRTSRPARRRTTLLFQRSSGSKRRTHSCSPFQPSSGAAWDLTLPLCDPGLSMSRTRAVCVVLPTPPIPLVFLNRPSCLLRVFYLFLCGFGWSCCARCVFLDLAWCPADDTTYVAALKEVVSMLRGFDLCSCLRVVRYTLRRFQMARTLADKCPELLQGLDAVLLAGDSMSSGDLPGTSASSQ